MTQRLDAAFAALSDPTRRRILTMLLEDDMAVTDVAAPFAISLAAISKHLGVLARAGLIVQERRGRVVWCKLDPDALREVGVWMQGFGQFDPVDLEALETMLSAAGIEPGASENEAHDGDDDDHKAHEIDDLVHGKLPFGC